MDKVSGFGILIFVIGVLLFVGYGCSALWATGEAEVEELEQLHQTLTEHGVVTKGELIDCFSENYKPRDTLLTYKFIVETQGETTPQEYITKKLLYIPSLCNPKDKASLATQNRIRYLPEDPNQNELVDIDIIGAQKGRLSLNPYARIGCWVVVWGLIGFSVLVYLGFLIGETPPLSDD